MSAALAPQPMPPSVPGTAAVNGLAASMRCPPAKSMWVHARLSQPDVAGPVGAAISNPKRGSPTISWSTKNQPVLVPANARACAVSASRASPFTQRGSSRIR